MDKSDIQMLRDLPIGEVAERLGLQVNGRGQCLCPFHDDHHPSMALGRHNQYRCFVCDAHGDVIDLVMKVADKSFREACGWLAEGEACGEVSGFKIQDSRNNNHESFTMNHEPFDAARYARFFERPFLIEEARRFLFEERRLDERVVRWCRLTSWRDRRGMPWLQIPYYDRVGRLIGVQNRNLVRGALPRFRFPKGSECGIYNLPVLNRLKEGDELWITEGASDCWAMLSSGRKAIAIPSATLLTPKDVAQLSTINCQLSTEYHMFPDADAPGERLFMQLKEVLPNLEHHHLPKGCKDYGEMYLKEKTL